MNNQPLYTDLINKAQKSLEFLVDKPEENAESTVRALWCAAAGNPVSAELAMITPLPEIDDAVTQRLHEMISKRIDGLPLAYITKRQRFYNIEFIVESEIFIARKETELLAGSVINKLKELAKDQTTLKTIDLCTGMGNIPVSIACNIENIHIFSSDIMPEAVELARKNAVFNKVEKKIDFRSGDLFQAFVNDALDNSIDFISCNPPYISTGKYENMTEAIKNHEPRFAFDGGSFGLSVISRLLKEAPLYLKSGGWLAFELGLGQGEGIIARLNKNKSYKNIHQVCDIHGNIRAILVQTV